MTEQERYQRVDLPFYREEIRPVLPPTVLDFHAHVWSRSHWRQVPAGGSPGGRYMVVETEYPVERLAADARRIFPDNGYRAVVLRHAYASGGHRVDQPLPGGSRRRRAGCIR